MRFHISHLMLLVAVVALVLGVWLHPESLIGAAVTFVGWALVVAPVLGTVELLHWSREQRSSQCRSGLELPLLVGWAALAVIFVLGLVVAYVLVALP